MNLTNGNVQQLTLTTNATITLTSPTAGSYRGLLLYIFQDATGMRTVTWPPSVKWGVAGVPILSSAPGSMDMVHLATVDGGSTWYGVIGAQGF
ncbi:hypothetical protein EON76_02735 [bacterium]|nr:MAG: hypothetical protein EON76_02735 [bacterium]